MQALPQTPLWDRLQRENRLHADEDLESNVAFRLPYDVVLEMWRDCMAKAYAPKKLFERYEYQARMTYPHRLKRPLSKQRLSKANLRKGLHILAKVLWKVGVRGDYKRVFWSFALRRLVRGEIEAIIAVGLVAHHLIMFARDATNGRGNASHYSAKMRMLDLEAPARAG